MVKHRRQADEERGQREGAGVDLVDVLGHLGPVARHGDDHRGEDEQGQPMRSPVKSLWRAVISAAGR